MKYPTTGARMLLAIIVRALAKGVGAHHLEGACAG